MEVITIESEAFKKIIQKLNDISILIEENIPHLKSLNNNVDDETYVDSDAVKRFLGISERTMQRIRTEQLIPYSKVRGRAFYKVKDLKAMLEGRIVRTKNDNLDELIKLRCVLSFR